MRRTKEILRASVGRLASSVGKIIDSDRLPYLLVAAIILLVYLPFVLRGGFIIDDWAVALSTTRENSSWQLYLGWLSAFSNRPVAPIVLVVFAKLFGTNPVGYVLGTSTFWIAGVLLTAKVLERRTSRTFFAFFALFAAFPLVATTVIFSVGMQLVGTSAFLFWALSFFFLDRSLVTGDRRWRWGSYLLILLGLLTYEVILPLLVVSALYPSFVRLTEGRRLRWRPVLKDVFDVVAVVLVILAYQKFLVPLYMPDISRLHLSFSLVQNFNIVASWLGVFFFSLPIMLLSSLFYGPFHVFGSVGTVAALSLVSLLFFCLRRSSLSVDGRGRADDFLLAIFILAFFSGISLYVLNGVGAGIGGYGNRGSSSAWICFSLVMAWLAHRSRRFGWFVAVSFVLFFTVASFTIIRDQYISSYAVQLAVADDVVTRMSAQGGSAASGAMVLASAPHFLPGNFNDEDVFDSWGNFGLLLNWRSGGLVDGGHPLLWEQVDVDESGVRTSYYGWSARYEDLWFYEGAQAAGEPRLVKVEGPDEVSILVARALEQRAANEPRGFFETETYTHLWSYAKGLILGFFR